MRQSKSLIPHKSRFDAWKETIDTSRSNSKWNELDLSIKRTVDAYNQHLKITPGYFVLDWKIIKAVIWTETGALRPEWSCRPMQIGNNGDSGMSVILAGREGSALIVPPAIRQGLTAYKIRNDATANIQAGVGYLLTKSAIYGHTTVMGSGEDVQNYTVKSHDTLSRIAIACGTTVDVLNSMNANAGHLKPGLVLSYRKASRRVTITGWKVINTWAVGSRYNGGGDPKYKDKLDYCLSVMK